VTCAALTLAWLVVLLQDLVKMTIDLTATERLLGRPAFDHRVAALRARAPHAVPEWTAWAAARRQLVVFAGPALGLAFLVCAGQGIWGRRLPTPGRARGRR
jgi:hypothetical protein